MDFKNLTIASASKLLRDKKITVKELVYYFLENSKSKNPEYNIYLEIYDDIDNQISRAQEIIDSVGKNSISKPLDSS